MEFITALLIAWIETIVLSLGMELANLIRIFKEAADNGYKIDLNKLSKLSKPFNNGDDKDFKTSIFVPGVNIVKVFQNTILYNNNKEKLLDYLNAMDSLIPMTKEEIEKYKQKPTSMNALVIYIKSEVENEPSKVSYFDGGKKSTIWYKFDNYKLVIVKTAGPVSNLPIFEQREKLDDLIEEKIDRFFGRDKSTPSYKQIKEQMIKEGTYDIIKDQGNVNAKCIIDDKMPDSLTREETIQKLEELKSFILNINDKEKTGEPIDTTEFVKTYKDKKNS